ncbi:MAG: T9SS type A sorting domain-containing protein [Ignavibacteriae bacterium]|nr:T9SS type A sorting domain-containing protein [Ignavibacteriota bacterium]
MKKLFALFILLISVLYSMNLDAQVNQDWKWVHPAPQGNQMRWIKMIDSVNWYTCGNTGTFMKTSNAGVNWTVYTNAGGWLPSYYGEGRNLMNGWFFNMNTGVVCGYTGWIARTTNAGASWDSIGIPTTNSMYGLHFVNNTYGYASGAGGRVLKTTNAGLSWDSIPTGVALANYNIYALDTNIIYVASTVPSPLAGKVMKTINGGINWVLYNTETAFTIYDINFINENTGMVCGSSGNIKLTTNGGVNWTSVNSPSTSILYGIHSTLTPTPTFYVVGDSYGIYKTDNFGANWTLLSFNDPGMSWTSTHYSVDVSGNRIVAIGAYGSIQKSTNAGANFSALTQWLSPSTKYDVWAQSANGLVIVTGGRGSTATFDQVLRTTNGGTNWSIIPFNSSATYYSLAMVNSTTGFMSGSSGNLRKTTNAGLNWDSIPGPFGTNTLKRVEFANANTGYVFQNTSALNGGWKTTNGGLSWDSLTNMGSETRVPVSSFINANTGYVGNNVAKLMKTTDGGANWTILSNTPMGTFGLYGVKFFNADSGYVCGSTGYKLCRTTNGGVSFDSVSHPFYNALYSMRFFDMNTGWIFASMGYSAKTTNGGTSWFFQNTSGQYGYGCYFTNPDSGFVVGDNGYILKTSKQTITGIEWSGNKIPGGYYLKQNYPNPFNPTTTIEFAIPKAGLVSLKIYDIAGREITNAINMSLNPGIVKYTFNGASFASGVYFYRLTIDEKLIDTKKMVLIK